MTRKYFHVKLKFLCSFLFRRVLQCYYCVWQYFILYTLDKNSVPVKDGIVQNSSAIVIENVISTASCNVICFYLIHTTAKSFPSTNKNITKYSYSSCTMSFVSNCGACLREICS